MAATAFKEQMPEVHLMNLTIQIKPNTLRPWVVEWIVTVHADEVLIHKGIISDTKQS